MDDQKEEEEKICVPEDFFKDVHFYPIGTLSDEVNELLEKGGAKEESYLTDRVTHVIAEEEDHPEVSEARDLFELPVVSSMWVCMSIRCKTLLPGKAFAPESNRLFSRVTACFSQLTLGDRNALWSMVTFYGGECRANLSKDCTHLVTAKCEGVKYECASQHENEIKIVGPDWVTESIQSKKVQDERTFHPKYIADKPTTTCDGALPTDVEMKSREDEGTIAGDATTDQTAKDKKEKMARPKLKLPWADDLMPLPDISAIPEPLRDAPPTSNTATSSTFSPSSANLSASYSASSAGLGTPTTHKPKDKKHKKDKKKKKKHKKEKKKKDKKKHKHSSGSAASPFEGATASTSADQATKNRMLRNITNKTEYLPAMTGVPTDKKHISQVLSAVGGRPAGHKGRLDQIYGGLQAIPELHYCGHDASAGVTPDSCLLGCIFLIMEYPHLVGMEYIDTWRKVIIEHGGIVDDCYSDRITHILCDTQRSDH